MRKPRLIQGYLVLIFFMMFIFGISNQTLGTLISRIISHYGISMVQAGLLSSFLYAGNFAAILIVSVFAGRINKMILLGGSLFFLAVSLGLVSAAPLFGVLLAGFALIGVFNATLDTLLNSLVADLMPDSVSVSMSLLHGLFGLGGLCGPIIIERLAVQFSWTQAYFIISMAFLIYLVIYAVFVKRQWNHLAVYVSHEKQVRFGFADIIQFFSHKRHVLLWSAMFLYAGGQSILSVWIKRYVETHLERPDWGAYALSAMWLGTALSRLIISTTVKASPLRKIFIGNLISGVALSAGLLSGSVQGIVVASLVVGLSSGLSIPLILAQSCQWHQEKTAFGTLMPYTALFISYVIFPPSSGLISDLFGIPWGVALGALCAILAAVFSGALDAGLRRERE